jgi:curved DNA-binding protein CbpA
MSFKIEQGLFGLDFTDYHAVLGVPVDAGYNDLRKKYLKIARRLHPDSCSQESEEDRQRAAEYLSKLVNPAYEKVAQEKDYSEYILLLKLKGDQARRQQETVLLTSDLSKKLAATKDSNIDSEYKAIVRELAEHQYEHLNKTLEVTGQLSELNLVYLMRKDSDESLKLASRQKPPPGENPPPGFPPPRRKPPEKSTKEIVDDYLRRSQEYETKGDYVNAVKELKGAIQVGPKDSRIHSAFGRVYIKINQPTMAKIHLKQALSLNPNDEFAIAQMRVLDPSFIPPGASQKEQGAASETKVPQKKGGTSPKQSGGGLFGGIFGGKKK